MLISQPGSDYQITQITLDAGHARDITCLLLDIHLHRPAAVRGDR